MAQQSALKAIGRFASCDVADALVKLGHPYGGYMHGIRMFSPVAQGGDTKIFGPAYTVLMVDAADKSSPTPSSHFVDNIPDGSVVMISQPRSLFTACWGGLMATRAQKLGAKGIVIDGNFRDINEHRELGMPMFARAIAASGSASFTRSAAFNVPIHFTSETQLRPLTIKPGDYILADADGVVAVPPEKAEECLKLVEERARIDEQTLAALKAGEPMGPVIARLRK
ncbi:hypothetical protein M409DRAFT_70191 [Zasmidium cellare ATCC 36951]|uniref:RraA-like protein n=1 Tax=Zasmidium cellare ATCC 36951 TaxID=1080233 RepID=A0A6A6C1H4_ZASCE|nr:uncharacterized protein M409DRAFT_70191 [Zasmidium cellare ATCC 36951]KAF2160904.1 hypothetical protein M409DRAFT_70191 [Zasmidium cellare ATCC 36951]